VFAKVASDHILANRLKPRGVVREKDAIKRFLNTSDTSIVARPIKEIKASLKQVMQKYVGVFRSRTLLSESLIKLEAIKKEMRAVKINSIHSEWNTELLALMELENLMISAECTAYSAINREESRGAHYREDFPLRDDENFLYHSIITRDYKYQKTPPRFNTVNVDFFAPESRKY
jgi:succinate dehydrogenase/fumarate reductase flavoprotein subunit